MASGTDTHNALFQHDSSRFTFFWESVQRNRAMLVVLEAESLPHLCDGVFGYAWTQEHVLQLFFVILTVEVFLYS